MFQGRRCQFPVRKAANSPDLFFSSALQRHNNHLYPASQAGRGDRLQRRQKAREGGPHDDFGGKFSLACDVLCIGQKLQRLAIWLRGEPLHAPPFRRLQSMWRYFQNWPARRLTTSWPALRPAPMARMTVAALVTISPPAKTLGIEVSPVSGSASI